MVVRERRIGVGGSGGLRALTVRTAGVEDVRRSVEFGDFRRTSPEIKTSSEENFVYVHLRSSFFVTTTKDDSTRLV